MYLMFDVIGFGALNLDRLFYVKKIAFPGEHEPVVDLLESPGGSAANTIAWLADAGFSTGFIGAVGTDSEGCIMLDDFRRRGVGLSHVKVVGGRSGVITGFVDSKGERTLYPYPGANDRLFLDKKTVSYAGSARFLHLTSFVGEKQLKEQKRLIGEIGCKVKLSFSPGDLYAKKGLKNLKPIVERSFVVFLNRREMLDLTGMDYRRGSDALNLLGARIVVVTLGGRGCYVSTLKERFTAPCRRLKPVDTTGAGDSFAAGFLAGLMRGKTLVECARMGNKNAGKCILCLGARMK